MEWTLDRGFFRLLVGLYLLATALAIGVVVYEMLGPGWEEFSAAFDSLVEQHFGAPSDTAVMVAGGLVLVSLVWHLISLIGLRKFRPWARWSFWASMALAVTANLIPGMAFPSFTGPLGSLTGEISTGLFAAILLLSYSRDHGGMWFKSPLETLKDTF